MRSLIRVCANSGSGSRCMKVVSRSLFDGKLPFGDASGLMDQMAKAKKIKEEADAMNTELHNARLSATDSTGQAEAIVNGLGTPINVKVTSEVCKKGANAVSLAVTQAIRAAHTKATTEMSERIGKIYADSGMPIPDQMTRQLTK